MSLRFHFAIALSLFFGCRSPSPAVSSPNEPCASSAPRSEALTFPTLRIDSRRRPFDHDVLFASGSSEPLASSMSALDQIADTMKAMPDVTALAVMGHAESSERPEIAGERATRVIELLTARGIDPSRLEARPFTPPPPAEVGRCGMTTAAEEKMERQRALAAERAVHFAIARVDDP